VYFSLCMSMELVGQIAKEAEFTKDILESRVESIPKREGHLTEEQSKLNEEFNNLLQNRNRIARERWSLLAQVIDWEDNYIKHAVQSYFKKDKILGIEYFILCDVYAKCKGEYPEVSKILEPILVKSKYINKIYSGDVLILGFNKRH
jgi:predicted nuclease with TOPRIM domain